MRMRKLICEWGATPASLSEDRGRTQARNYLIHRGDIIARGKTIEYTDIGVGTKGELSPAPKRAMLSQCCTGPHHIYDFT